MVIGLCETFGALPSQLDEESAEIVRLMNIRSRGTKKQEG